MRRELDQAVPGVEVLAGTAEEIPLAAGSVDAVTVAQAFHWFRLEEALAEIHRVMRGSGGLALIWNERDLEDPLQAEIEAIIAPYKAALELEWREWREPLAASGLFGPIEERTFGHDHFLDVEALVARVHSTSVIAALASGERHRVLERVRAAAAGLDEPFPFRYVTEVFMCFRQTDPA
jgi:SAM-dependent methyltransferase